MPSDWVSFGLSISYGQLFLRIIIAIIIGAAIGIDREIKNRPAGMRTHVLVCLGATLIALLEQEMIAHVAALADSQINVSVGRLTGAVVSGIGFLGAGTIVMSDKRIIGLTTAASLWCTACIGLAIGSGYTTMAVITGIVILFVLRLMQRMIPVKSYKKLEVQFIHRNDTLSFLNDFFANSGVTVLDVDFHAEQGQNGKNFYTNVYTLSIPNKIRYVDIIEALSEKPNILAVRLKNI